MIVKTNEQTIEIKYLFELKEDATKFYVIKDNMVGVADSNGRFYIPAKFKCINQVSDGSYVCSGIKKGKEFCEIYDKDFKLKTSK